MQLHHLVTLHLQHPTHPLKMRYRRIHILARRHANRYAIYHLVTINHLRAVNHLRTVLFYRSDNRIALALFKKDNQHVRVFLRGVSGLLGGR